MQRIVTARLQGSMRFEATTRTGHVVMMDGGPDVGGEDAGARPYDLLLVGLAGCTGMDVISILRKKRQRVTGFWIDVDGQRSSEHPKVYTQIAVHYHVQGTGIDPAAVERAIQLSETTYCSAIASLRASATVSSAFTIHPDPEG